MPIMAQEKQKPREPASLTWLDHAGTHANSPRPGPDEAAPAVTESDESLVADPRAGLTSCQIIDQRLLALLGSGNQGSYIQATGRPGDVRRQTGE